MPNPEDDKKPKPEKVGSPEQENQEESARLARQGSQERQAAAALARVEITEEVGKLEDARETVEKRPLDQIRFIHIDDEESSQQYVKTSLESTWGMKNQLGKAKAVDEAVGLLRKLASQGENVDLIILDQEFFVSQGDASVGPRASELLVQSFVDLRQDPSLQPALGHTKIIMFSGTADREYLKRLQSLSQQVIGLVVKGNPDVDISTGVAGLLANAGSIESSEPVREAQRRVVGKEVGDKIKEKKVAGLNPNLLKNSEHVGRQSLLRMINEARQGFNLEPLQNDSPDFAAIVEDVIRSRGRRPIDQELLFKAS